MVTCKNSSKQNAAMNSKYTKLAGYLIILWIAYPIVWALAEGQELISVNAEVSNLVPILQHGPKYCDHNMHDIKAAAHYGPLAVS